MEQQNYSPPIKEMQTSLYQAVLTSPRRGAAMLLTSVAVAGFSNNELLNAEPAIAQPSSEVAQGRATTSTVETKLDNADVQNCQNLTLGTMPNKLSGSFFKVSKPIYSVGRRTISIQSILKEQQPISANEGMNFLCSKIVKNSVKMELLTRLSSGVKTSVKPVAKLSMKMSSETGNPTDTVQYFTSKLTLPKKLTNADFQKRKYGVKETVSSVPLIQIPHNDASNPSANVQGPMETKSKGRTIWLSSPKSNLPKSNNPQIVKYFTSPQDSNYQRFVDTTMKGCNYDIYVSESVQHPHNIKASLNFSLVGEPKHEHFQLKLTGGSLCGGVGIAGRGDGTLMVVKFKNGGFTDPSLYSDKKHRINELGVNLK